MKSVRRIINARDLRKLAKSLDHVSWHVTCKALHAKIADEVWIVADAIWEEIDAHPAFDEMLDLLILQENSG